MLAYTVYSLSTECMHLPNHPSLTFGTAVRRSEQLHSPQKTSLDTCHACSVCMRMSWLVNNENLARGHVPTYMGLALRAKDQY